MADTQGLIILNTGEGKGKTTAALGMVLRTLGHQRKVLIRQFIKGSWTPGEKKALEAFGDLVDFKTFGDGFLDTDDPNAIADARGKAEAALNEVKEEMLNSDAALILLDEILYTVSLSLLNESAVIELLDLKRDKRRDLHLVLTGRGATPGVIDMADLVTEMRKIKHPYEADVLAQPGIEF